MPDPWVGIEESALAAVSAELERTPLDRAQLKRALHVFAIAKNRDLSQTMPDIDVLDDNQLRGLVAALVRGNQLGR